MDNISIAYNSLFSVHGRRFLIITLFGIFGLTIAYYVFQTIVFVQIKDVLKNLDGDFARMIKEIHSLRQNVTILETETENLKRNKSMWEEIKTALAEIKSAAAIKSNAISWHKSQCFNIAYMFIPMILLMIPAMRADAYL
ncbi:uncharacterized protein LOC119641512 isoform X2 [Glossina fuscipes]|uniref:Uncharacterized protein LOC119641512 isoform X2 n=1 Tax=Glossina fuscipes TaxID=7396 RepID=A0A9C6DYB6_9MUSC|nr:uncharacterized protein LOC119641512 isoform X2 [Glossina fuscipes]